MTQFFHHQDMHLISVDGEDAANFLNDLLTAQIAKLDMQTARMACLLSPQGRILFDMMVVRHAENKVYLITETAQAERLAKLLMMYRLRRKVTIAIKTGVQIGHICDAPTDNQAHIIVRADERNHQLGYIAILTEDASHQFELCDDASWQTNRIRLGIPQSATDLTPNRALMLEAGLEHLNAVDFKKGCYVGQEVTARTHYRGLVKRRILPVHAHSAIFETGQQIDWQDKQIGTVLSVDHSKEIALASIRLDAVHNASEDAPLMIYGNNISIDIPDWMQPLPRFDNN